VVRPFSIAVDLAAMTVIATWHSSSSCKPALGQALAGVVSDDSSALLVLIIPVCFAILTIIARRMTSWAGSSRYPP